jgi:hypothetical protein
VSEPQDVDEIVQKIEELIEELGKADASGREKTEEIIRLLMNLYGSGLSKIADMLGTDQMARLAEDRLVASLLLLHGLHIDSAETRIRGALEQMEHRLDGAHFELVAISEEAVRVKVNLNGGSSPPPTVAALIQRVISDCAPDIDDVQIDGLPEQRDALVQIAPAASG